MKSVLRFLLACLWLVSGIVCAKDLTVAWDDPNAGGTVDHWQVRWANPTTYNSPQDAVYALNAGYTITGLTAGLGFSVQVQGCDATETTCSDWTTLTTYIPSQMGTPTLSNP